MPDQLSRLPESPTYLENLPAITIISYSRALLAYAKLFDNGQCQGNSMIYLQKSSQIPATTYCIRTDLTQTDIYGISISPSYGTPKIFKLFNL